MGRGGESEQKKREGGITARQTKRNSETDELKLKLGDFFFCWKF